MSAAQYAREALERATHNTFELGWYDAAPVMRKLARAVIAVAELHRPTYPASQYGVDVACLHCVGSGSSGSAAWVEWPCPTVRALSDALEVKETESEWEYGVGWQPSWCSDILGFRMESEAAARAHAEALNADPDEDVEHFVVRRTPERRPGPWEPVEAGESDD